MTDLSFIISTYKRPELLRRLLDSIARMDHCGLAAEVVIVDNDSAESARVAVESLQLDMPIAYAVESQQNIALARNRCLQLAQGEWIAMLDDDGEVAADWLKKHRECQRQTQADLLCGPVIQKLPPDSPAWVEEGQFFSRQRFAHGSEIPYLHARGGNVLFRRQLVETVESLFNPDYGRSGGEDTELFERFRENGAMLIWSDQAVVHEAIEADRVNATWLIGRIFRGGQNYARQVFAKAARNGRSAELTAKLSLSCRAIGQLGVATVGLILSLPFGQRRRVHWARLAAGQVGKLSGLLPYVSVEYKN